MFHQRLIARTSLCHNMVGLIFSCVCADSLAWLENTPHLPLVICEMHFPDLAAPWRFPLVVGELCP